MDLSDPENARLFKNIVTTCGVLAFLLILVVGSVVTRPKVLKDLWRIFVYAVIGAVISSVSVIVAISYINANYL